VTVIIIIVIVLGVTVNGPLEGDFVILDLEMRGYVDVWCVAMTRRWRCRSLISTHTHTHTHTSCGERLAGKWFTFPFIFSSIKKKMLAENIEHTDDQKRILNLLFKIKHRCMGIVIMRRHQETVYSCSVRMSNTPIPIRSLWHKHTHTHQPDHMFSAHANTTLEIH